MMLFSIDYQPCTEADKCHQSIPSVGEAARLVGHGPSMAKSKELAVIIHGFEISKYYVLKLVFIIHVDDFTFMVPSYNGVQSLIHICEDFTDEYDVLFNGSKSHFMIFEGRD